MLKMGKKEKNLIQFCLFVSLDNNFWSAKNRKDSKKLFGFLMSSITSVMTGYGENNNLHGGGHQHGSDNQPQLWHHNA